MIIDPSLVPHLVRLDLYEIPVRMMDAVIRSDHEQYVDCFVADGVWDPSPLAERAEGVAEISRRFQDSWATLRWAFQGHFQSVVVSYSEGQARLRTYLYEAGVTKIDPTGPIGLGCYTDDLVLVDGKWKVVLHDLSPIYFGSTDFLHPIFQEPHR